MIRHCAAVLLVSATLIGCDSLDGFDDDVTEGVPIVEGFFGGVAGDEPRAVLVARSTLAAGGSAADAVVAYFFASAVTYPAASSLAAGGACIAYTQGENQARLIDFRDAMPAASPEGELRPTMIPGAVRGMAVLHAEMGVLAWTDLITPAERMARFGHPVSRALARDLSLVGDALIEDPGAYAVFTGPDGRLLREGDDLIQLDLSAMLTYIRTRGAGDFYTSLGAAQFVEAVQSVGNRITLEDMRNYRPQWRETYSVAVPQAIFGAEAPLRVPGPGFDAGATSLWVWSMYDEGDLFAQSDPAARAHLQAATSLRAAVARTMAPDAPPDPAIVDLLMSSYSPGAATPIGELPAAPTPLQENPASTSVSAVDAFGNAASCVFTMNSLFGNGRVAPGTGIVLAARPGEGWGNGMSLMPALMVNENTQDVIFVGATSGGIVAGPVMATVTAGIMQADMSLAEAIDAPRVFDPGLPDVAIVEEAIPQSTLDTLIARGYELRSFPELGRVNAIYCPGGVRSNPGSCSFVNDPRGFGLAVGG
ncbi:MAG: gamma-glutamyltransferase [Pseudomonadota bacterium]